MKQEIATKSVWICYQIFLCTFLKYSGHPKLWTWNLVLDESKIYYTDLLTTNILLRLFSRCIITVRLCVDCAKGKNGQRQFTYHIFSWISGTKTKMLLIIFLGLFAKITLPAGGCDVGTQNVDNFDWTQVSISVWTKFMKQESKLLLGSYISFVDGLKKS
jgi:hypothetical protein